MTETSAADYKKRQLEIYQSNADGWEQWAAAVAEQAESFNLPLIAAAGIAEGHRVLDLASGAGEPALSAAKAVGAKGHVTATDLSPAMLAVVERRAQALGLANMSFEVTDMEALPFGDDTFDAAICRFGFMYSPNPDRALAGLRRVVKPGGRVALAVWGPKESNSLLWTVMRAANRETEFLSGDEMEHPFCYGAPDSLTPLLTKAGFVDAGEQELRFSPGIPKKVPFWTPLVGMNFAGALADMSDDRKAALNRKVGEAFAPFLKGEKYRLEVHIRIASGTCP